MLLSHFKGHFLCQKGSMWNFVIYWANITESVHVMTTIYMICIAEVMDDISVYRMTFSV